MGEIFRKVAAGTPVLLRGEAGRRRVAAAHRGGVRRRRARGRRCACRDEHVTGYKGIRGCGGRVHS